MKVYTGTTPTGTPIQTVVAAVGLDGSYSVDAVEALPDGLLTAQAEQDDLNGNTGLSAPNTFTVDTEAPPSPTIDSSPPDPSSSTSASFSFSDSEAGVSFRCQLDGGGFSTCSSPQSYTGLAEGGHSFQVKARDALGNESASATYSWTVDTLAPPTPTIDSNPPDPSASTGASFSFSDSEAGVTFRCQLDGGGFSTCSSPQSYSGLGEGGHSFQVKARDAAGNESAPASYGWTVDSAAPPARRSTRSHPTRAPRRVPASPSPTPRPASPSAASSTVAASAPAARRRATTAWPRAATVSRSRLAMPSATRAPPRPTAGRSTRWHRQRRRSTRARPTRAVRRTRPSPSPTPRQASPSAASSTPAP